MNYDVFVSYSNKDKSIADTIVASLEKNKVRCWYAPRDIKPGGDWGEEISNAIGKCKIFLIIFSGSANRSQHVLDELVLAIDDQITVIPFRVENLEPKGAMRLHLSARHWLDAYDPSWEEHINKLVETICHTLNKPYKDTSIEKPQKKTTAPKKVTKKKFPLPLAVIGIAAILIAGGWFGWSKIRSGEGKNTEELEETASLSATSSSTQADTIEPTATFAVDPGLDPAGNWNDECRIAYVDLDDDVYSIYLMHPDGSGITPITSNEFDDTYPKWSPDAKKIAYISRESMDSHPNDIFVMDNDGSNRLKQTVDYSPEIKDQFNWSPDSQIIVYSDVRDTTEGQQEFVVFLEIYGRWDWELEDQGNNNSPVWSPDGNQVAFVSDHEGGNYHIYVVKTNIAEIERLVAGEEGTAEQEFLSPSNYRCNDREPAWSPDGQKIVFSSSCSEAPGEKHNIFIMNSDGSEKAQLTDGGDNRSPAWSSDGKLIAFISDREGSYELYVMKSDGSATRRLFTSEGTIDELLPEPSSIYFSWSPDKTAIAFSTNEFIYIVNIPEGDITSISNYEKLVHGWYPVWSPYCRQLPSK